VIIDTSNRPFQKKIIMHFNIEKGFGQVLYSDKKRMSIRQDFESKGGISVSRGGFFAGLAVN